MNTQIIDLSKNNCWMVYLSPFDTIEENKELQDRCTDDNFPMFGIGWGRNLEGYEYGDELNKACGDAYVEEFKGNDGQESLAVAIEYMLKIKENDLVIMRLVDGNYYIGKVIKIEENEGCCFYIHSSDPDNPVNELSWGCRVEKWYKTIEDDVPSEIRGRFSQRLHKTLQPIQQYRQRLLVLSLYDRMTKATKRIPAIAYTKTTFARSMHYMQLEDLVYLYISNKLTQSDKRYVFFPSSGKINRKKYEFSWIGEDNRLITCQVKNQAAINLEDYRDDCQYKCIFLFCGLWNQDEAEKKNNTGSNITVITPSELYEYLINLSEPESLLFNNHFYTTKFSDEDYPPLETIEQRAKAVGIKCKIDEANSIIHFGNMWRLIYAPEVGRIIQLDDNDESLLPIKVALEGALKG